MDERAANKQRTREQVTWHALGLMDPAPVVEDRLLSRDHRVLELDRLRRVPLGLCIFDEDELPQNAALRGLHALSNALRLAHERVGRWVVLLVAGLELVVVAAAAGTRATSGPEAVAIPRHREEQEPT